MLDDYKRCPYCGRYDKPCSEITSLARAWARDACRKQHGNVKLPESSIQVHDDFNFDP